MTDLEQLELARSLVGKRVVWGYVKEDGLDLFRQPAPAMRVECATPDGMICVEGFSGEFAPTLFRVVP